MKLSHETEWIFLIQDCTIPVSFLKVLLGQPSNVIPLDNVFNCPPGVTAVPTQEVLNLGEGENQVCVYLQRTKATDPIWISPFFKNVNSSHRVRLELELDCGTRESNPFKFARLKSAICSLEEIEKGSHK